MNDLQKRRARPGRPPVLNKKKRYNVMLSDEILKILDEAGKGNRSRGITVVAIFWKQYNDPNHA